MKKDGEGVKFNDGKTAYNTDDVCQLLSEVELSEAERKYLNGFSRLMYDRYKAIRDCCNPKKCKKISILEVRERLEDEGYKDLTIRLLKINPEQINYILDYVSIYFRGVI